MISTDKHYHAEAPQTIEWNFRIPPSQLKSAKLQLLTIGGISVTGVWEGELGQYYVAWAPMMKYDKSEFNRVVEAYRQSRTQPSH